MAVIELDMPTGFEADLESSFTDLYMSKKAEIRNSKTVVLYYDEVSPWDIPARCIPADFGKLRSTVHLLPYF